jgi:hypothetical protein
MSTANLVPAFSFLFLFKQAQHRPWQFIGLCNHGMTGFLQYFLSRKA